MVAQEIEEQLDGSPRTAFFQEAKAVIMGLWVAANRPRLGLLDQTTT